MVLEYGPLPSLKGSDFWALWVIRGPSFRAIFKDRVATLSSRSPNPESLKPVELFRPYLRALFFKRRLFHDNMELVFLKGARSMV